MKKRIKTVITAVLIVGMFICVADKAYWLGIGQYAYNIIYIFCIMPACVVGVLRTLGIHNL